MVQAHDLRDYLEWPADARDSDLRHLAKSGLIRTVALDGRERDVVVLTKDGRDLLEPIAASTDDEPRQVFYAGLRKPRELTHDAQVYRAYLTAPTAARARRRVSARRPRLRAEARVSAVSAGAESRTRGQRRTAGPRRARDRGVGARARAALLRRQRPLSRRAHRVRGPRRAQRHEDIEVVTGHYRGAHACQRGARPGSPATAAALGGAGGRGGADGRSIRASRRTLL